MQGQKQGGRSRGGICPPRCKPMTQGAPRGGKGKFCCLEIGLCGVLCTVLIFSQVKLHWNIEISEHISAILRVLNGRFGPNKKTRQAILHVNEALPAFLVNFRQVLTCLRHNNFRRLNVGSPYFSHNGDLHLDTTSTSPETVVCATL